MHLEKYEYHRNRYNEWVDKKNLKRIKKKITNEEMIPLFLYNGDLITTHKELFENESCKNKPIEFYKQIHNMIKKNPLSLTQLETKLFIYNGGELIFNIELLLKEPDLNIVVNRYFIDVYDVHGLKYKNYLRLKKLERIIENG